jgi:hypothetical protein
MTMARMTYACEGGCKELTVASAYLPYDSEEAPPTKELWDVIDHCHIRKKHCV